MENLIVNYIINQIQQSEEIIRAIRQDEKLLDNVQSAANACINALKSGKKIMLAGNGGSASDAQHIAGEFVSRFNINRPGLPAMALTTDTSILTAIGNDYGFDQLFARQIQAHAQPGDIFIAYSTSGQSPNIIEALKESLKRDVICIGMTGSRKSPMRSLCDYCIEIPSTETPKIQEGHAVLGHIICGLVENVLFLKDT